MKQIIKIYIPSEGQMDIMYFQMRRAKKDTSLM